MKSIVFLISFVSAGYIDGVGFRCGRDFNNDICPEALCCSEWGYCGTTIDYCNANCQSNCPTQLITSTTTIVPMSVTLSTTTIVSMLVTSSTTTIVPISVTSSNGYPVITPTPTATMLPSIFRDSCNKKKTIALTFDDGISDLTNNLLTYLSNNKIPATFFIIGNKINTYRAVLKRMYKLGFEIGCHTWDHPDLTLLTDDEIRLEISQTNNLIKQVTGKFPKYFRAPYLSYDDRVDKIVREFNMLTVSVNLDSQDWVYQGSDPSMIYQAFTDTLPLSYTKGYISLQHDRYKPSIDLVPSIVDYIKSVNYKIVSMNECLS
jgi:peptidoglycan/xylan/chitin deacetylase (PgdA/CDA1 family)